MKVLTIFNQFLMSIEFSLIATLRVRVWNWCESLAEHMGVSEPGDMGGVSDSSFHFRQGITMSVNCTSHNL